MSTRYRSEDDTTDTTPLKRSKIDDRNTQIVEQDDTTVSLDVLKAEARERRNSNPDAAVQDDLETDENDDNCIICLQPVVDRTYDYQKHYLPPLRTSPPPSNVVIEARAARRARVRRDTAPAEETERDELDRAIEKRRWVYRHGLFAKHVASNAHTRFRPNPTPQQISNSAELQSRCQMFVRRELRVWPNMDVEFLTSFILSLVKSIDIRTEAAIKLIGEFLDLGGRRSPAGGTIAEHFVHELYSYLRSPFRDLPAYDAVVQYDTPADIESAPTLPRPSSHFYHNESGLSRRRTSSFEHKGKVQERESSDPLDASPRDINPDPDSEEDWVEPPPTNSKGKARDPGTTRGSRTGWDDYGRRDTGDWDERGGQPSKGTQHAREDRYEDEPCPRRHEESHPQDFYDDAQHSKPDNRGRHSESRPSPYDDGRRRQGQGDNHVDNRNARRQRSRESQQDNHRTGRRLRKPAGWDNFFEDDRPNRRANSRQGRSSRRPLSSRSRSPARSSSATSRSRSPYENGHRRRESSPVGHRRRSSPDSRVLSSRPLTTSVANHLEDNWTEPLPSEQTTGKLEDKAGPTGRDSEDGDNTASAAQPRVITKPVARSRPPRLAPMDAIRMHLQGQTRTSRSVPTANTGGNLLPNPEAQPDDQDGTESKNASAGSSEATEASTALGTLSPNMAGKPPMPLVEMLDERTLDGNNASPHVATSPSYKSPTASYSIRGAAARPKSQPAPPFPFDSTQRASPGSPHGPNPSHQARSRLLARLEAAKSMGTISNTDTDASYLSGKLTHRPTTAEPTETPVLETQIAVAQEQRLRLMARTRMLRSATNGQGPSPGATQGDHVGAGSHQGKKADNSRVPAEVDSPTAAETERRLRLQARLAARKRDITTLMGAPSSADSPPRPPSSGTRAVIDRAP